jgi:hypothetical protein
MSLTPFENPSRIPPRPFPRQIQPILIATKRNQNMLQLTENKQRQTVLIATKRDMRFSCFGLGFCTAGILPALFLRKFVTVYLGTPASPLALFLRSCAPALHNRKRQRRQSGDWRSQGRTGREKAAGLKGRRYIGKRERQRPRLLVSNRATANCKILLTWDLACGNLRGFGGGLGKVAVCHLTPSRNRSSD